MSNSQRPIVVFVLVVTASLLLFERNPSAVEGKVIFKDNFDEQCTTCQIELSTHAPIVGSAWIINEDTSGGKGLWKAAGGRDWLSPLGSPAGVRVSYVAKSAVAHSPDYAIVFRMANVTEGSAKSFLFALVRRTASDTYYGAGWYHYSLPNDCYLFKVVNGKYSQLANGDCNIKGDKAEDNDDVMGFSAVGTALTLWRNGAPILTAQDSSITTAGDAGLGMGNVRSSGDVVDSSMAIDDLTVVEAPFELSLDVSTTVPTETTTPTVPTAPLPPALPTAQLPLQPGDNGYFDSLVGRAEHWKSYSLRSAAQVDQFRQGTRKDVTYSPATDTYPYRQDGAKVVIPDFAVGSATLAAPMSTSDTTIVASGIKTGPDVAYKIDNEVMIYSAKGATSGTFTVTRGAHGTLPASHAAGAPIAVSTNSLLSQVRLPMGTEDGHTYLTTWDVWYGSEIKTAKLSNWKTFQFGQGATKGDLGLEVRTRFALKGFTPAANELAKVDMRAYLKLGPEMTSAEPISPMVGDFTIHTQTWTRYWALIEHVPGSWDKLSLWMADETRNPVLIINKASFEADSSRFHDFWLEFNTSQDALAPNRGPLTMYVRNVVMLKDVTTPTVLMLRPTTGSTLPTQPVLLQAPKNLHVVN